MDKTGKNLKWLEMLRLLPYTPQFVINTVLSVVFFLVGVALDIGFYGTSVYGPLLIYIVPVTWTSFVFGVSMAGVVQSSPVKNYLQIRWNMLFQMLCDVVFAVIFLCIKWVQYNGSITHRAQILDTIVTFSIGMFILKLYNGVAYKYYWTAVTLLFMICYGYGLYSALKHGTFYAKLNLTGMNLSFWKATLVLMFMFLLGNIMEYLLTVLLYKKPISKSSQGAFVKAKLERR